MSRRRWYRKKRGWALIAFLFLLWVGTWVYNTWFQPKAFYKDQIEWYLPIEWEPYEEHDLNHSQPRVASHWDAYGWGGGCIGKECEVVDGSPVTFPHLLNDQPITQTIDDAYDIDPTEYFQRSLAPSTVVHWYPRYPILRYRYADGYIPRCYDKNHRLYREAWCQEDQANPPPPTVVTEPSALGLFLAGLIGLWIIRRYRQT